MWLIDVNTMHLEYSEGRDGYAILSHRWQEDEVLFQDMQTDQAHKKAGYRKLERFCQEAAEAGHRYAWCDTCCIDKTSSAELSESINSMFRWYRNATMCYAYLFDVGDPSEFGESAWFTRGWCLQELLAPRQIAFYGSSWQRLGSRDELATEITARTGIHSTALAGAFRDFSVAQRMSWAADRITTRVEDVAYSLLGIFGVNMPLLYGEGMRAFIRLQEEILRRTNDQSVLVHSAVGDEQGLFATSPADFRHSSQIVCTKPLLGEPYSLTNAGLSIELTLYPWTLDTYVAVLDCRQGEGGRVGIFVQLQPQITHPDGSHATDHAIRVKLEDQAWVDSSKIGKLPAIRSRLYLEETGKAVPKRYGYWIRRFERQHSKLRETDLTAISWNTWGPERIMTLPHGSYGTAGVIKWTMKYEDGKESGLVVRLGFSAGFEPVIELNAGYDFDGSYGATFSPASFSADPVQMKSVLSSVRWMTKRGDNQRGIWVPGKGRERLIRAALPLDIYQPARLLCEKVQVDGADVWALDLIWQSWNALPPGIEAFSYGSSCDECRKIIQTARYKCRDCPDFDLCADCIHNAPTIHDINHEFELKD